MLFVCVLNSVSILVVNNLDYEIVDHAYTEREIQKMEVQVLSVLK